MDFFVVIFFRGLVNFYIRFLLKWTNRVRAGRVKKTDRKIQFHKIKRSESGIDIVVIFCKLFVLNVKNVPRGAKMTNSSFHSLL
jgi:hypothetical protein